MKKKYLEIFVHCFVNYFLNQLVFVASFLFYKEIKITINIVNFIIILVDLSVVIDNLTFY